MSGTFIAQLLNIAAIPVLSRLFTTDDFGIFAVYFGLSSILSAISCGRYELAIMLPKKDNNAYQLVLISFLFLIVTTLLAYNIILLFSSDINELLNVSNYKYLLFLVPVLSFFISSYRILNNWFSRLKKFKNISVSSIYKAGGSVASKISFGLLLFKSLGLFAGEIFGQLLSVFFLFRKSKFASASSKFHLDKQLLKKEFEDNKNFPLFSMPMAFLNSVSAQILVYFLTIIYNVGIVGLYTQANKIINYPLSLLTSSFISVFYQKLTETKQELKLYAYSYFVSLAIALAVSIPIFFWGEELFAFVLGEQWTFSGYMAKLLIPIVVFGFATRNTSIVFSYLKLQQISLIWQILYLLSAFIVFFYFKDTEIEVLLLWFSCIGGFLYFILGLVGYIMLAKRIHLKKIE